jgi:hypothetical protein
MKIILANTQPLEYSRGMKTNLLKAVEAAIIEAGISGAKIVSACPKRGWYVEVPTGKPGGAAAFFCSTQKIQHNIAFLKAHQTGAK